MINYGELYNRAPELDGEKCYTILQEHAHAEAVRILALHRSDLRAGKYDLMFREYVISTTAEAHAALHLVHSRRTELVFQRALHCVSFTEWNAQSCMDFASSACRIENYIRAVGHAMFSDNQGY